MPAVVTRVPENPQEWFDAIIKAFLDGKLPCGNESRCYYRLGNKACVVGLLIPDEKYLIEMDDDGDTGELDDAFIAKFGPILPEWGTIRQYREVQRWHDNLHWLSAGSDIPLTYVVNTLLHCSIFSGRKPWTTTSGNTSTNGKGDC